MLKYKIH